jgi:flagellar basal-body rod protein FlgC
MSDLDPSMTIAASGMAAQSARIKIIAQNLANADSTATAPGQDPYRRQEITFKNVFDRVNGVNTVQVAGVVADKSDFHKKFDPSHPAADTDGYVATPNVNPIIETTDMHEAENSYQANLSALGLIKTMDSETINDIKQ